MSKGARSLAVVLMTAVLAGLVAFYVVGFLRSRPSTVAASEQAQHRPIPAHQAHCCQPTPLGRVMRRQEVARVAAGGHGAVAQG